MTFDQECEIQVRKGLHLFVNNSGVRQFALNITLPKVIIVILIIMTISVAIIIANLMCTPTDWFFRSVDTKLYLVY